MIERKNILTSALFAFIFAALVIVLVAAKFGGKNDYIVDINSNCGSASASGVFQSNSNRSAPERDAACLDDIMQKMRDGPRPLKNMSL